MKDLCKYYNLPLINFGGFLNDESNAYAQLLRTIQKSKKQRKSKGRKKKR